MQKNSLCMFIYIKTEFSKKLTLSKEFFAPTHRERERELELENFILQGL